MTTFNLVGQFNVSNDICVQKYFSEDVGMNVVLAQMKGPVMHAYFVVPTQPESDGGEAHALEHLIYGGSEDYPYKGVIDILANRYLSYGCSAETNKDYTCFKLDIACSHGLYLLLPVFLDHLLYPLLNESTFITDIYHINGEGKEGGTIYTELLSREGSVEPFAILEACRALYPGSGYSYNPEGLLEPLRNLNIDGIRDFHKKFYQPENVTVFIAGRISPDSVFAAIEPIEQKILNTFGGKKDFENNWEIPESRLEENTTKTLPFPSDERVNGSVYICWRGPNSVTEYKDVIACFILLDYLCSGPVCMLKQTLEENNLVASIEFQILELIEVMIVVKILGVEVDRIQEVQEKIFEKLQQIIEGEVELNMERLKIVIQTFWERELNKLEEEPHLKVFQKILPTIIYLHDNEDQETIESRFNLQELTDGLMLKTTEEWIELIKKYFVENFHVTVEAIPSIVEQQIAAENEQTRLDLLKLESDLESHQAKLDDAMVVQNESPPEEMIAAAELLATAQVNYHWSLRYCSSKQTTPPGIKLQKMPVYSEAYDLSTSFVYISAIFGTDSAPSDLRLYLPLFVQLLTNSPILIDDELISLEELSTTLEQDLVSVKISIGLQNNESLSYFNHFMIMIQVEIEKYEKGLKWLHNILYNTVFEVERIKICALELINQAIELKHNNQIVGLQALNALIYEPTSNINLHSMMKQKQFLETIIEQIDDNADQIQENLQSLRQIMILNSMEKVSVHMATDWSKLHALGIDLNSPWTSVFPSQQTEMRYKKLYSLPDFVFSFASELDGIIIGRASAKTSCLNQAVSCINSYRDLDLPGLVVFLQYLNQPEGIIWKSLKGKALAYEYSINIFPHEGFLKLFISQSNNVFLAYKELRTLIEAQLNGDWNESLVESAKSTCIYNAVYQESTISKLIQQSIVTSFNDVPYDQNKVFIKKLQKVDVDQLKIVGEKYVSRLFCEEVKTSCICPLDQVEAIQSGFESFGINLLQQSSVSESILAHL